MAPGSRSAYKVQENVKKSIESMTDLKVTQVNIHIQGVSHEGVRAGSDA